MKILVLNAGSSSQKSCLYQIDDSLPDSPPKPLWSASVDWTRHPGVAEIKIKTDQGVVTQELPSNSRPEVISHLLDTLTDTGVISDLNEINIVGHRVVHGGEEYREATLITPQVKDAIIHLSAFAPVHNPANVEGVEAIEQVLPNVPQVAVFDTAFHRMPLSAAIYPGSYQWFEEGIRRYGFHGISHQYCAGRTAQLLQQDLQSLRLIVCHLGNGCSLAAIRDGVSIDTTMGFTPLDGLMMGSRSGSIDPGILIYLLREQGFDADKLDRVLNYESGLKGISGISGDMRQIQSAIASGNSRASLAFDIYVHSLQKHIGSMLASLGGLDALVFTAGVGENVPDVRALACEAFGFMGIKLDQDKNAQSPPDCDIATEDSSVRVLIVHTQEDWAIATQCWQLAQTRQ